MIFLINYLCTTVKITNVRVTFEKVSVGGRYFYVYYDGEAIDISDYSNYASMNYSLYGSENYVISSGSGSTPYLKPGENFKDSSFSISLTHVNGSDLQSGATYTLSLYGD